MATLLLTALGTAIGGPLGGAIGAFIGQQADRRIFGSGRREGPRLKELSVTTSSYGQPVPRQFGQMRVAGSVIWATDLMESRTKQSGGKGQPSVVTYSYSASFAVALSSTPIARVGRIWADGNLLRGASGDLKVGGQMRLYHGHGDDPVDPLIAADKGQGTPAFRDFAYVVFEDLQLADFGNRIPALTFEVFAESAGSAVSLDQLVPQGALSAAPMTLAEAHGFADEGGPLISSLAALDQVFPLICTSGASGLTLTFPEAQAGSPFVLPEQLSLRDHNGEESRNRQRADLPARQPVALRYYDEERDYQPGVQRALGQRDPGREAVLDLPATMNAAGAKQLANANAYRARWQHERITWRISELDPALAPGRIVQLPDQPGRWLLRGWEWHNRGVELTLERMPPNLHGVSGSDAGVASIADDVALSATVLAFIEAPVSGTTASANTPALFAAASALSNSWRGAALFAVQGNALIPIGTTSSRRAVIGTLALPVSGSAGLLLEPAASLEVILAADDLALGDTDLIGLSTGANRLLVGGEVMQFARARHLSGQRWRLECLLRARAGTEQAAMNGHAAGTPVVLLDDKLTPIETSEIASETLTAIAAQGIGDTSPVVAGLLNAGLSRRPLSPVHARRRVLPDGSWEYHWTRRARGQWLWRDGVDVALAEETESYLVGYGPPDAPLATWERAHAHFLLTAAQRTGLPTNSGEPVLWVRQIGTYAQSAPLLLGPIS